MSQVMDFDALDDAPATKLQMMSYKGAVRSPPWFASNFTAMAQELRKMKEYFIRNSSQGTGGDARVYDVGRFYFAYEGPADTTNAAGELYVEYTVELRTPNLEPFVLSGWASLSGTPISPAAPGTEMQSGPLTVSLIGDTTNTTIDVGVDNPGVYWLTAALMVTTANVGKLNVSTPTGSNATVDTADLVQSGSNNSANNYVTFSAPVFFPTTSDLLAIGPSFAWTSAAPNFLFVSLTPLSQETFGFPESNVQPDLPMPLRRGMEKLVLASLGERHSSSSDETDSDRLGKRAIQRGFMVENKGQKHTSQRFSLPLRAASDRVPNKIRGAVKQAL